MNHFSTMFWSSNHKEVFFVLISISGMFGSIWTLVMYKECVTLLLPCWLSLMMVTFFFTIGFVGVIECSLSWYLMQESYLFVPIPFLSIIWQMEQVKPYVKTSDNRIGGFMPFRRISIQNEPKLLWSEFEPCSMITFPMITTSPHCLIFLRLKKFYKQYVNNVLNM